MKGGVGGVASPYVILSFIKKENFFQRPHDILPRLVQPRACGFSGPVDCKGNRCLWLAETNLESCPDWALAPSTHMGSVDKSARGWPLSWSLWSSPPQPEDPHSSVPNPCCPEKTDRPWGTRCS